MDHLVYNNDEASSFTIASPRTGNPVPMQDVDKQQAWFTVPAERVLLNGTMHIILAVTDNGTPALARYQHVIVNVD